MRRTGGTPCIIFLASFLLTEKDSLIESVFTADHVEDHDVVASRTVPRMEMPELNDDIAFVHNEFRFREHMNALAVGYNAVVNRARTMHIPMAGAGQPFGGSAAVHCRELAVGLG